MQHLEEPFHYINLDIDNFISNIPPLFVKLYSVLKREKVYLTSYIIESYIKKTVPKELFFLVSFL